MLILSIMVNPHGAEPHHNKAQWFVLGELNQNLHSMCSCSFSLGIEIMKIEKHKLRQFIQIGFVMSQCLIVGQKGDS